MKTNKINFFVKINTEVVNKFKFRHVALKRPKEKKKYNLTGPNEDIKNKR